MLAAFRTGDARDVAKFRGRGRPRVRRHLAPVTEFRRQVRAGRRVLLPRHARRTFRSVRFLPRYDELLISYEHRDRVIAPAHRRAVYTKNAIVEAVVMVDGFAAGTWKVDRAKNEAVLGIAPFAHLARRDRAAIEAEGRGLLSFLAPDASSVGVRFA